MAWYAGAQEDTGDMLADMLSGELWSFGLPFGEVATDGEALVAYYAGSSAERMDFLLARLQA